MRNSFHSRRYFPLLVLWLVLLTNLGCSRKPNISKDSAEYQYSEAKKAVTEIKYEKAISVTGEIQSKFPNSEYAEKARILRIILLAGLSKGYQNMAEAYISGFEKSVKNAGPLRSTAFDYYRKQKNAALGLYGACDYFLKNFSQQNPYILDCEFPSKDIAQNSRLDEVRGGKVLDSEQRRIAEEDELRNSLIRTLISFVGAGGDRTRARKLLESGSKSLDHAEFMVMLGRILLDNQKLFGRTGLNDIQNYRQFYQKASDCTDLALKILKDKPNKEIQAQANELKGELEALEKKDTKIS